MLFVCISCKKNENKHNHIRYMYYSMGVENYIIVIGDPTLQQMYIYDNESRVLTLKCEDSYEALPCKIVSMCKAVKDLFDPKYIVKVDDDVVLKDISFLRGCEYGGLPYTTKIDTVHTWHMNKCSDTSKNVPFVVGDWIKRNGLVDVNEISYACGGSTYVLGRKAIHILTTCFSLCETHMYEDMFVGYILYTNGIQCERIMNATKKRDIGVDLNNKEVMLKNKDIRDFIHPKYIGFKYKDTVGAGLNDRKCMLTYFMVIARAYKRILCIEPFKLNRFHNHDSHVNNSIIINEYILCNTGKYLITTDRIRDPIRVNDIEPFDENTESVIINIRNIYMSHLARRFDDVSFFVRNTDFEPIPYIKHMGDKIIQQLRTDGKRIIGVHLRKGDRMTQNETHRFTPQYIFDVCSRQDHVMYVATNELGFVHQNFKTRIDFHETETFSKNNYLLFALEMYIVENCDVHIKTFQDSEHLYGSDAEMYYLIPRSMHIHDNKQRDTSYIPEKKLFEMTSLPSKQI